MRQKPIIGANLRVDPLQRMTNEFFRNILHKWAKRTFTPAHYKKFEKAPSEHINIDMDLPSIAIFFYNEGKKAKR